MSTIFSALLICISGTNFQLSGQASSQAIQIFVDDTWQIPYASDIQDLCFDWQYLVIRSNGDGKLYLADPGDCSYQGEIDLPSGEGGFGVAFTDNGPSTYYINSSSSSSIFYSDGSDTWSSFSNPAGTGGAGMNFDMVGGPELFEASADSPYQFYGIETDGTGYEAYPLAGITDEISGFMPHEVMTMGGYPPGAAIVTTRLGHEFFFFHQSSSGMTLYGQEPCPVPVLQSLGLAWNSDLSVYWSYQAPDSLYYVARLLIPVFGDIADETGSVRGQDALLEIESNPARSLANLTVNMPDQEYASLEVYDVSGRLVETVQSGIDSFTFEGSPGLYIAVLSSEGQQQSLKFILTR